MAHRLGGRNGGLEANREEDLVAGAVLRERTEWNVHGKENGGYIFWWLRCGVNLG
jgi:hypothetical protein